MRALGTSKKLATAAIGAAIALLAIIGAYYIPNISISLNVAAALGLLIPLSQKYYKEGILAYVAASGLGAIFTNIHILNFVLVTGFYTIIAIILYDKKIKWYITAAFTLLYGSLCFFILYKVTALISLDIAKLNLGNLSGGALYAIFNIAFIAVLAAYHYFIIWINRYIAATISKIIK